MKSFWSLILTLLFGVTSAQEVQFFTTQSGLPSNLIYQTVQDTSGFIWIATPRGLSRFDGENFKTYTIEDGLVTNDIFSIAISQDNKVWFGAKSRYQGYIENDSVYLFPNERNLVITGRHVFPYKGGFGFSPYLKDVCSFVLKDSVWQVASSTKRRGTNGSYSGSSEMITQGDYALPKTDHSYYFPNDSVIQHVFKGNPTFRVLLTKKIRKSPVVECHGVLLSDSLYGYFYRDEYLIINLFTGNCKSGFYQTNTFDKNNTNRISHSYFNNELHLRSKYFSFTFDQKGDAIDRYFFPVDYGQSFISKDYLGNVWMIGNSLGLGLITKPMINQTIYHHGENVKSIYLSGDSLYLATLQGSLCRINLKTNQEKALYSYSFDFYELKKGLGKDIMALGSHSFGSVEKSNHFKNFDETPVPPLLALKSFELHNNRPVFVAHIGLVQLNTALNKLVNVVRSVGLTSIQNFNSTFYVSTSEGLKIWEKDSILSCHIPGLPEGIPIKKLKPYYSKYLFAATEGYGIFAIDGERYFEMPATKGLSVENLFVENDTAIWLATQKGVYLLHFNPNDPFGSSVQDVFFQCDGLVSDYVNDITVTEKDVFAATDKGVSVLHKKLLFNQPNPLLYVDEVWKGKQKLTLKPIRFPYSSEPFIVKYGAIRFAGREHLTFHYALDQGHWIATTSQELSFNNLKPGQHTLRIKVTNHHADSSLKSLSIYVVPLWWQTIWFRAILAIVALVLLYLLYIFTKNRIAKREKEKADFNQKLSSLELMALRSQMNPHFVFNSLGAIQYYIQENQLELSEKYLVKFSKLTRLFFEYSRVRVLILKEEIELLDNYLNVEKMRFGDDLDFSISVDSELDIEESSIPSMLLQPLVENAINHGLFHKKGKGKVEIEFLSNEHNGFEVYIKDDGIGLKKGNAIRKSSLENYRSSSTEVIKENISLLNQQGEWLVNYKTKARYPERENSGTVVHLNFKLKHENIHENQNSTRR